MGASDVLRSPEVIARYKARKQEVKNAGPKDMRDFPIIKMWRYWILVENEFPYDLIAESHALLVPKREFQYDQDMRDEERAELFDIKNEVEFTKEFDAVLENLLHNRTIPGHYHLHFMKLKYRTPVTEFNGLDKK